MSALAISSPRVRDGRGHAQITCLSTRGKRVWATTDPVSESLVSLTLILQSPRFMCTESFFLCVFIAHPVCSAAMPGAFGSSLCTVGASIHQQGSTLHPAD